MSNAPSPLAGPELARWQNTALVAGVGFPGAAPLLSAGEAPRPFDYRDRKPTIDAVDKLRVLSADKVRRRRPELVS